MQRKRLILFTNSDPGIDPGPALNAYHFATVASEAGLEAEVRLAAEAVRIALPGGIAATTRGDELRENVRRGVGADYRVSL